ncbi:glycosyltransferase family 92 protein [Acinetobacter portensis]|uniref:Glycosyltransferase family 92 protein n=1 Tax=Acinetobacter portensis TaxID=1839785 RepID=A0ABY4JYG8_9GAMM|nr:glycosyltransferase family 92 protein [Acinetobacter portensis]MCK7610438.1 glycosyltransferase family 92 protein [Acinetobacter portensis]MCK7641218.1 glycosyltransferase family 92 protein [Acinetobacter portensis]UPO23383.1 glycosyltransferase family 92 protein [Acinetobacter portensis]
MSCFVFQVNPIVIPEEINLKRREPRKPHKKDSNYDLEFDYKTFSYDIFKSENKLVFSGPPINGLEAIIKKGKFFINGNLISNNKINIEKIDRACRLSIHFPSEIKKFTLVYNELCFEIKENFQCYHDLFLNKKVLLTKSKNNNLRWIHDWIEFYKSVHDINSVIIYDNNSDQYSIEDLKNYLSDINIDIFIIPWNFKFGPIDAPFDSDFCQYGILEHAKECFLAKAAGVIQVDVDELIFSKTGRTVFDALKETPYLKLKGEWIEPIPYREDLGINFNNFYYRSKKLVETTKKWCIDPRNTPKFSQWRVHDVNNCQNVQYSEEFYHLHYKIISTNWRWNRSTNCEYNKNEHYFDQNLFEIITNILPINKNDSVSTTIQIPKIEIENQIESEIRKKSILVTNHIKPQKISFLRQCLGIFTNRSS